jgi:hypothetical protein
MRQFIATLCAIATVLQPLAVYAQPIADAIRDGDKPPSHVLPVDNRPDRLPIPFVPSQWSATAESTRLAQAAVAVPNAISMRLTVDKTRVAVGDTMIWQLRADNLTYSDSGALIVTHELPPNVSDVVIEAEAGVKCIDNADGKSLTCRIDNLQAQTRDQLIVNVEARASSEGVATATSHLKNASTLASLNCNGAIGGCKAAVQTVDDEDDGLLPTIIAALKPKCTISSPPTTAAVGVTQITLTATCTFKGNLAKTYTFFQTDSAGNRIPLTNPTPSSNVQTTTAPATVGSYTYSVVARNGNIPSNLVTSSTVQVNVNPAPKIQLIAPNGGSFTPNSVVTLRLSATDNTNIASVTATVSPAVTASVTSCTGASVNCTVSFTPTASGIYTVTTKVTDSDGAQTTASTLVAVGETPGASPLTIPPATSPVGTAAGQFAVSESGAATYSIPIQVPPGVAGLQPNLAISYNSQGGDGHLGVGFGLSGLSMITRCPKTIATDGVREPINYDNITDGHSGNDAFCLDGQRLMPYTGTDRIQSVPCSFPQLDTADIPTGLMLNGNCPAWEFRTELESYNRIVSVGESDFNFRPGSGPTRFRVYSKSGQVLEYGSRWWGVARARPNNTVSLITNPGFDDTYLDDSCWIDGTGDCLSHINQVRASLGLLPLISSQIAAGTPGGYFKSWNTGASTSGWTFSNGGNPLAGAGVQRNGSSFSTVGPNTTNKNQTAYVQANGTLSTISYLEAGTYDLTFSMAGRGTSGVGYGGNHSIGVKLAQLYGQQLVVQYGPYGTTTGSAFADSSALITVAATGWHTITFAGLLTTDQTAFIDNVRLVPKNRDYNVIKMFPLDRVEDRAGNYMHIDYSGTSNGETVVSSFGRSVITLPATTTTNGIPEAPTAQGARPALEMYPRRLTYGMRTSTPSYGNNNASVSGGEISRVILNYRARNDVTTLFDTGSSTIRLSQLLQSIVVTTGGVDDTSLRTQRADFFCRERGQNRDVRFIESSNTAPFTESGCVAPGTAKGIDTSYQCTDGTQLGCGTVMQRYNFTYSQSTATKRSRLDQLQMCALDSINGTNTTVCLPATTFQWSDEATLTLGATGSGKNGKDVGINWDYLGVQARVADIVGDGRSRIVKRLSNSSLGVCTHDGTQFTCQTYSIPTTFPVPDSGSTKTWHLADVNGDGIADLVVTDNNTAFACLAMVQPATGLATSFGSCANLPNSYPAADNRSRIVSSLYPLGVRIQSRLYAKPADVDGDGRMDIVFYRGDGRFEICRNTGSGSSVVWTCANPGYIGVLNFAYTSTGASQELDNTIFADFNGDGRTDIAMRVPDVCVTGTGTHGAYDPSSGTTVQVPNGTPADSQCLTPADTTSQYWSVCFASGRFDVTPGAVGAFQFNCSSKSGAGIGGAVAAVSGTTSKVATYDFNGDGLADLATKIPGQDAWRVCLSVGDGEFYRGADANGVSITTGDCPTWIGPGGDVDKTVAGDFNGDGRTDLARWKPGGTGRTWEICLSTGSGFSCSDISNGPRQPADRCAGGCYEALVGDYNGDGKSDIVVNVQSIAAAGTEGELDYNFTSSTMPNMVQSIKTGLLAETRIRYAPLSSTSLFSGSVVYSKTPQDPTDPHFPAPGPDEIVIQSPMYVVESSWASTGGTSSSWFKNEYRYIQLVANKWGRGLYGFRGRNITENLLTDANNSTRIDINQITTGITSSHKWPHIGRAEDVVKAAKNAAGTFSTVSASSTLYGARCRDGANAIVSCPSSNTPGYRWESFQVLSIQNPRYFNTTAYPSGITTELDNSSRMPTTIVYTGVDPALYSGNNAITPALITTSFPPNLSGYYDSFGNPLKVTTRVLHPNASTPEIWDQSVTNTYHPADTAKWMIGQLALAETTSSATGTGYTVPTLTRKSSFTYHNINSGACVGAAIGQLCTETVEPDWTSLPAPDNNDKTLYQQSAYEYDAFGNRTKSKVSEPPRVLRRLLNLRDRSRNEEEQIFPGSARTLRSHGV